MSNLTLVPIRTIDGDEIRKRALTNLRLRLGREPTSIDIDAERTAEAQRQPMAYLIYPRTPAAIEAFRTAIASATASDTIALTPITVMPAAHSPFRVE